MHEMISPMRQPVSTEGIAAISTTVNSARALRAAGRARRPDQLGLDRGRALIGREQDREHGVGHDQRDLGGIVEAEDQDHRRIERDLRQRREHAHQRLDDAFDELAARRRDAERDADDERDGEAREQAEQRDARVRPEIRRLPNCWISRANTARRRRQQHGGRDARHREAVPQRDAPARSAGCRCAISPVRRAAVMSSPPRRSRASARPRRRDARAAARSRHRSRSRGRR